MWNYSWSVLTWAGKYSFGLLEGFINSRFAKAATLEPTNYSYFLVVILFVVISIGWFEISGRIKKDLEEKKEGEKSSSKPKDKNNDMPSWVPKIFLVVRLMVLFYLLNGLLFIAGEITVLNAVGDFKQHVRIITPYVTKEKKEMIISSWSQMRGLEDYNKIHGELLRVAKENNLTLYKNRAY